MSYVDGYVLPVPKKNMAAYRSMAKQASVIWRKYGALEYFECVADDLKNPCGPPFPKAIKAKPGETVVFSFVMYRSFGSSGYLVQSIRTRIVRLPDAAPTGGGS